MPSKDQEVCFKFSGVRDIDTNLVPPQWVYYHAGGVRGARPVLRGADAKETFDSIPIVDVSGLFSSNLEDRKKVAAQIGEACRTVGFFYAQNHSVPHDVIDETFDAIKNFFALPAKDKMEVHLHKNAALRGYEPVFETNLEGAGRGGKCYQCDRSKPVS